MLRRIRDFVSRAITLAMGWSMLAALAWVGFFVLKWFATANPTLQAAVIAPIGTVAVYLFGKRKERELATEQELRKERRAVYDDFVQFGVRMLSQDKPGIEPLGEEDMVRFLLDHTGKSILWASDDVFVKYAEFRQTAIGAAANSTVKIGPLYQFIELLLAMRKDLGHANRGVDVFTVMKTFINDMDEVYRMAAEPHEAEQIGTQLASV